MRSYLQYLLLLYTHTNTPKKTTDGFIEIDRENVVAGDFIRVYYDNYVVLDSSAATKLYSRSKKFYRYTGDTFNYPHNIYERFWTGHPEIGDYKLAKSGHNRLEKMRTQKDLDHYNRHRSAYSSFLRKYNPYK